LTHIDIEHLMTIMIAPAHNADVPAILALLERSALPQDGLRGHVATTIVGRAGDTIVGSAALELYGTAALLRSISRHTDLSTPAERVRSSILRHIVGSWRCCTGKEGTI
jgi:hypothetical protein